MSSEEVKTVWDGKFLLMKQRGRWEFVQRKNISGIVGIVPVTDNNELVLIDQYRAAVDKRVFELPAGLAGDIAGQENEPFTVAADRELIEETGYKADKYEYIFDGVASVGMTDEAITFFLATGLEKIGPGGGDDSEDIIVHIVPIDEVVDFLEKKRKEGFLIDLKIYSGLYFANKMHRQ